MRDLRLDLPQRAVSAIRQAHPETLTLPSAITALDEWVKKLSPDLEQFASVASVFEDSFTVADLIDLTGEEPKIVVDHVYSLIDSQVLVESEDGEQFSFEHLLVRDAYAARLPRKDATALHRRRYERIDHVTTKAHHVRRAGVRIKPPAAIASLIQAAHHLAGEGLYGEAIDLFTDAQRRSEGPLPVESLIAFAVALEVAGADGRRLRTQAFDIALESGDVKQALQAAIAGDRLVEWPDGNRNRAELLVRLDGLLQGTAELERLRLLAWESGLLGEHERAFNGSKTAQSLATTPDELFLAWFSSWPSQMRSRPTEWLPDVDPESIVDPGTRALYWETATIGHLMRGETEVGNRRTPMEELREVGGLLGSVTVAWHLELIASTMAFLAGELGRCQSLALKAHSTGVQFGFRTAYKVRDAQLFTILRATGSHGKLAGLLAEQPSGSGTPILKRAAVASALAASGRDEEASTCAASVLEEMSVAASPYSPVIAACVSDAVQPDSADGALVRAVLEPLRELNLVTGAGIGHVGPTARSLANVEPSESGRVELLEEAVITADRAGWPVWQVLCRMDLAAATGDDRHLTDALEEFAVTADLRDLVSQGQQ